MPSSKKPTATPNGNGTVNMPMIETALRVVSSVHGLPATLMDNIARGSCWWESLAMDGGAVADAADGDNAIVRLTEVFARS